MQKRELLFLWCALASFTLFAEQQQYLSGEKIPKGSLPGAYNQSANYVLADSSDVYFTTDFIYWCLDLENVRVGKEITPASSGALGLFTGESQTVYLGSSYKPGFQVGMGFDMAGMDHWNMYSEYTWYQNKHTTSSSGEISLGVFGADVIVAEKASLTADYRYNNLNISLQRPFYLGRKLTMNFGWGLRALWIWQKLSFNASDLDALPVGSFSELSMNGPLQIASTQKSWALGPRFGLQTNWLFGAGFRAIADAAVSILYTRYTQLDGEVEGAATYGIIADLRSNTKGNIGALRAVNETLLGLGWESYLGSSRGYHLDVLLGYEFNIYWNQNMSEVISHDGSAENVYLHGLNVAIRFDF